MAEEAKKISQGHMKWMIETLNAAENKSCTYGKIVEVGEEKHCDTVGAMLKILKKRKVVSYDQMFLMFPMHKDEVITLVNCEYDPESE